MLHRRQFLISSSAAVCVGASWGDSSVFGVDFTQPVPEAQGLTAYQNGSNILVRNNNLPVLGYRAHPNLKYPYFCPLNGPQSGLSLTTESALPYPHHRGLWLGCDPVNGGNYWADNELEKGQICSEYLALEQDSLTPTSCSFSEACVWRRPGSMPLRDERSYKVSVPRADIVLLDCEFKLIAQESITIKRAKHSLFAMRAAADISPSYGGTLMNSEGGVGAEGTYGKPARWCGYHGPRALRPDVVEGIAIMNHPTNFEGDCPWFTREYGHLSPSPFNFLKQSWTLEKGQDLALAYRVVLHAGTPQEAGLDEIYEDWLAS